MNTLAFGDGHGPGPWILLAPLIWAAVVVGAVTLVRRTGLWRGPYAYGPRYATGRGGVPAVGPPAPSPVELLGRRFAAGEIDEEEYWRRLSVLDERFGPPEGRR
ncbi:SHOCT domain-containing protein [Streptomyces sp. NPDC059248]|uniref:SHOCT domain-containing protein n=1 Tax=Streptomyces sp. NPDC059248 TaxID=3346791 RepID=UPI003673ED12